jgi:hypothetical protein
VFYGTIGSQETKVVETRRGRNEMPRAGLLKNSFVFPVRMSQTFFKHAILKTPVLVLIIFLFFYLLQF